MGKMGEYIHNLRRSERKRSHWEICENWKKISSGTYLSQERIMLMNLFGFVTGDEILGQLLGMSIWGKVKVKISLLQAVEVHRVVRGQGSHVT
jgi:hypothetical protein